jgi:enoyl-[acyl-carrier protein] reductase II
VRFEEWQEIFPPAAAGTYAATPRVLRSAFVDEWLGQKDAIREAAPRIRKELRALINEQRLDSVLAFGGQTAGLIDDIAPAATIVREIVAEAEQALSGAVRLIG